MKLTRLLTAAWLLACAGSALAWHGHGHTRFGFYFGAPLDPWYYQPYQAYPSYYHPPTTIVVTPPPQVYIEQAPAAAPAPNYWYYCAKAKAYYPYVKQCSEGWMQVVPQSPQ